MASQPRKTFGGGGALTQATTSAHRPPPKPRSELLNPPSPAASVTSVTSAPGSSKKRKRDKIKNETDTEAPTPPALMSMEISKGESLLAHLTYAISYLKEKGEPKTVTDIMGYVSRDLTTQGEEMVNMLRKNPRVEFHSPSKDDLEHAKVAGQPDWMLGTYSHRPIIPGVRDKTSLLRYLQTRKDAASGVPVKDLKDGWPDCDGAISQLENEHKVSVVRTKKDGHARLVWEDDPSLHHAIDTETLKKWERMPLPSVDDLPQALLKEGQKPASDDPRAIKQVGPAKPKPKKKSNRRPGKTTNTHLQGILKDFSHVTGRNK